MIEHPVPVPAAVVLYVDPVFAPLDRDHQLERVGGGFETDVYRSDDRRWAVKLKHDGGADLPTTLRRIAGMRRVAEAFVESLGPNHSVPSYYVVSRDVSGAIQTLVVQPFLQHARPLYSLSYSHLTAAERVSIAQQLRYIVECTFMSYRRTRFMPDLYGMTSSGPDERRALRTLQMFPRLLWDFLIERNLLHSHNLLLTETHQVVLVDYDLVRWPWIVRRVYFAMRRLLHLRDLLFIRRLERDER